MKFRCFAKRHRKGEPKVIQNEVKIEFWALRGRIFVILGGFARGLIFDELLIGLNIRKIPGKLGPAPNEFFIRVGQKTYGDQAKRLRSLKY